MVSHAEVYCSLNQFPTETSSFLCTTPVSKPLHLGKHCALEVGRAVVSVPRLVVQTDGNFVLKLG